MIFTSFSKKVIYSTLSGNSFKPALTITRNRYIHQLWVLEYQAVHQIDIGLFI
jgi:hypothetical protein